MAIVTVGIDLAKNVFVVHAGGGPMERWLRRRCRPHGFSFGFNRCSGQCAKEHRMDDKDRNHACAKVDSPAP